MGCINPETSGRYTFLSKMNLQSTFERLARAVQASLFFRQLLYNERPTGNDLVIFAGETVI